MTTEPSTGQRTGHPRSPRHWLGLLPFALAVLVVAVGGGLAASDSTQVYSTLDQPWWAPPSWLFGPAWTVLYVLIAISGWLVWRRHGWQPRLAYGLYAAQLAANLAWTPLFFAAGNFGAAFVDIAVLWVLIVAVLVVFARLAKLAAALLLPYLAWVTYAAALNLSLVILNP